MDSTAACRFFVHSSLNCFYYHILRLFIAWILLFTHSSSAENDTLSFVIVLYRHGDRSATRTYKNDPYQEDFWPQGFGQLSQIGMHGEYDIGTFLRQRYVESGFLNKTYVRQQLYVRSTDYDRTIMSAQSVLAGLYPPEGRQIWEESIAWQPIPVHVVPMDQDTVLHPAPCDKLAQIRNETMNTDAVREIYEKYDDTLKLLNNQTGDHFEHLWDAGHVFDALYCELRHNLTLPWWVTDPIDIIDLHRNVLRPYKLFVDYDTEEKRRLAGGAIIEEYVRMMDVSIFNQNSTTPGTSPKLVMFSAHDTTVEILLGSLEIFNNRTVPYSTMVMVELHQLETDLSKPVVRIWLRNDTDQAPYLLKLPDCDTDCPYSRFKELTSPLMIGDNRVIECSTTQFIIFGLDLSDMLTTILASMIVGLVALILLLVCVVCCCAKRCRRHPVKKYSRIRKEAIPEEVPMMNTFGGSDLDD